MGKTSIEWTDATWNPITGCTEISPGCANCYAARLAATRLKKNPAYIGLTTLGNKLAKIPPRWTGKIHHGGDKREFEPLHWKTPRKIFVCDMADLFHEKIEFSVIGGLWSIMERCPQHIFQVLTKRPKRMQEFIQWVNEARNPRHLNSDDFPSKQWPVPNIWLGVSVENQHFADERIPLLLQIPAAVRWISAEPLLGPLNLEPYLYRCCGAPGDDRDDEWLRECHHRGEERHDKLDWVICGGESGANARPMHPDWARSLRDQCSEAYVEFFFKQWGEYASVNEVEGSGEHHVFPDGATVRKVGKKKSGRVLDGREWSEFPLENYSYWSMRAHT